MLDANQNVPFDIMTHLRRLSGHQAGEWEVRFEGQDRIWAARLCAIRKSHHAAARAKEKILQEASRKQTELRPETLEFAEYIFVLTSLPTAVLNVEEVLEIYRARWQIELCFKRLKSLFQLGHVPKRSDDSARAWIEGKLVTVLLIERLIDEATFFSPWGFDIKAAQSVEGIPGSP